MRTSKTLFKKRDFFGGQKSVVNRTLQSADPEGKIFKNPRRKRAMMEQLRAASADGKVTVGETRDALQYVFGTHHVSGAARREVVKNLGLPQVTSGDVRRFMRQENALKKALGKNSSRSDLPRVGSSTDVKTDAQRTRKIPVKSEDDVVARRNDRVRRINAINQEAAKKLLQTMNGNVNNDEGPSSQGTSGQPPTHRLVS